MPHVGKQRPTFFGELTAKLGEPDTLRPACEYLPAEFFFEQTHLQAQGRLRHMQFRRGAGH